MNIKKLFRHYRRFRPLPKLEPQAMLVGNVKPEEAFVQQMLIMVTSFSNNDLSKFLKAFDVTPHHGTLERTRQAKDLILEITACVDFGSNCIVTTTTDLVEQINENLT